MLLKSYNELSERYDDVRARDRRLIGILIFSAVVLLIFIINLLLKVRELKREDESAFYEEEKPRKNKPKTKSRQKAPAKEISRADDREPETGFYDADDRDIIDEFEEDPEILSSRRKKEREVRMQRMGQADAGSARKRTRVSDDDDIEFLDLN